MWLARIHSKTNKHPPTFPTIFQGQCVVLINAKDPSDLSTRQQVRHLHDPPSPVPNLPHCLLTSNAMHAAVRTSTEQQERIGCAGGSSTAMSLGATIPVSRPLLTHVCTRVSSDSASFVSHRLITSATHRFFLNSFALPPAHPLHTHMRPYSRTTIARVLSALGTYPCC